MSQRIAYYNGNWVPESDLKVPISDRGFLFGDAAFDVARTFRHKPHKLREHVERLYGTLAYLRIDPGLTPDEMERISMSVLERNLPLLGPDDDYWITQRVTRGIHPGHYGKVEFGRPTVLVYCTPVPFEHFAAYYESGIRLITPSVRRTPPCALDPRAKTHERINLILAHIEVAAQDPYALPLLLDVEDRTSESWTANFFIVSGGAVMTPPARMVLNGITRQTVLELAAKLGLRTQEVPFTLYDVYNSDEAFMTATGFNIAPVAQVNGKRIGKGVPGKITQLLIDTFSESVGVDIVAQAKAHVRA